MKLLAVGCVALLGLSMPAFASTGEWGPPRPEILPIVPGAVEVATTSAEEDLLDTVYDIFERLGMGEEGGRVIKEGQYRAERAADIADLPEEETEQYFRCRVIGVLNAPIKCVIIHP